MTKQLDPVSVFQTANNAAFHVEVDGVSRLISDILPDGTPVLVAYLAQWANRMVFSICWHDPTIPPPKYSRAASCFALKFREKLIGVTAAHVVKAFLEEKQKIPALTCQLRHLGDFDLEGALIDCDTEIDLATFNLTEAQLVEIRSPAFNCQNIWPPPEPQIGWAGAFAGFAEYLFRPDENFRVNADCLAGGVSQIEVGRSEIRMTYEPQTAKTIGNIPMMMVIRLPREPPISWPRSAASRLSSSPVRRHCKEATQAIRFVPTIVASAGRIRSAVRREIDAYQGIPRGRQLRDTEVTELLDQAGNFVSSRRAGGP